MNSGLGSIIKTTAGKLDHEDERTTLLNQFIYFENPVENISKNQNTLDKRINNIVAATNSTTNQEIKYVYLVKHAKF